MARTPENRDYPGVSSRTGRKGETIWRYRAKGKPDITLPGQPGEPAFDVAYQRATHGVPKRAVVTAMPGAALPRTCGAAARLLEETMEWIDFEPVTRHKYAQLLERFLEMPVESDDPDVKHIIWRNVPVEDLDPDRLRDLITGIFKSGTKATAKHMLIAIKKMIAAAIDAKWIKPQDDPSLTIRVRMPPTKGSRPWPKEIREQYEAFHKIGTNARTAYELGYMLGNRRSDCCALDWEWLVTEEVELADGDLVDIEAFDFRQQKNRNRNGGKEVFIPVVDRLAAALAPLRLSSNMHGPVLKTRSGRAYTPEGLTARMWVWTREAGLPAGYTLHGLRKNFGVYLAECNMQARAIMAAMGHSDMATAQIYVDDVDRRRVAVDIAKAINDKEAKRSAMKRRAAFRVVA